MGATSMATGHGVGGGAYGNESGVIGDVMAQLQALFYRKMHLNVTQMGHSPAPPPVALPRLNKALGLQMPAVTSALRRLQESLVGLAAAGSLTIPELIEKLDTCAKVFPPKSRPLAAARVFAFETLAAALARISERGERSRAFATRSLQGLEPAHVNLLLDGLVAPIVAVDFVDNFGGGVLSKPMAIAGQSMDADVNPHSTGSMNAAAAAVIGAMAAEAEKCLASLSNFMLVLVVNGVCDRFMGVQPSLQQDQGQSHLNIQSIGWEGQVKYLLATSRWKFGLIDPTMRSSTCRFLRAVLEFVVPSATRTAQKKVVVNCLVGIWRTLMAETRASPQANIQWQELLENEEDQLQVYLDIHGEAFILMQKWARKTKLKVHALSLMQVLLCHGTFEFFRSSKQREHFIITVMAACGDQACRPDVLDVLAAYIREVPSIFVSQIRDVWREEAMNLMSSAFPRGKAAPVAELRPLTDCLVALGVTELRHVVGAITNVLASPRHHSSHKVVVLRALARLLRDNPPLEIGRYKEELITMVTACLKEKDQPFLIGEALRCVPMLLVMATDGPGKWMFYDSDKAGREDGKGTLIPGRNIKHGLTQAEVLNLMRELCWSSDRTIALEATVALRENIHMLPMHLLSAALRIACRTITESPNAVAEDWRRRLTDVEAVLYEFLRRFSPRGSKMAIHFSRMNSSRTSSLSGIVMPGSSGVQPHSSGPEGASRPGEYSAVLDGGTVAKGSAGGGDGGLCFAKGIDLPSPSQWARIRVKVEGIVVLALAHHDRTVWMQAYQLLRLLDHDLFRAIEEPALRDSGVLSHRPSPRASPRRTPARYDRFGSGRYSGYGFGLQSVYPPTGGFRGGSRDGLHSRKPSTDVERPPFLADCLLRKPLSAVDLDVWRTRGAWCNVYWAPELWYLLLQQYDRYEVCLQWAWSKISKHNIWSMCPRAAPQTVTPQSPRTLPPAVSQTGAVVSPPTLVRMTSMVGPSGLLVQPTAVDATKSTPGVPDTGGKIKGLTPEMMGGAFQLWRNLLHFAILCLRLPNHPEFDLEEAARNLEKYDAKGEERNRALSMGFNTAAKKYLVEFSDVQARAWIRKRRMPRVAVKHCLRRAWEQAYAPGMSSGTPEIAALLTSLEALDPTCHEALILEMKGSEVDRMSRIHGNSEKKQGQKGVKKPDGQSEIASGKGPSFYYQESVLELLSQLYKRTLADAYRAGPVPVRSALEEFVSQWVQDQDDLRFEKLPLKVRIYAISMIENYLLYTTASLKAVASQAASSNAMGSSTDDVSSLNPSQQKSLVPSLSYRQKVFKNLTVKWVRGARGVVARSQRLVGYARLNSSVDSSGATSETVDATGDTDTGSVGYPASEEAISDILGDEENGILDLEIAVARAVKALIGMGPVNDSPFESEILRFLQAHHSRGGPVVRENVREALAQLLEHNPHRLKNFIAASFKQTWIRKNLDKLEAKELALTYFRALVQTITRRVDDWLNTHNLSPAKMSYLCLLHMCSHHEPMRHLALELVNVIEAACPNSVPPGWGILPASAHAPPDVYIEAAIATSRSLASAHPEYTPAILREALALQQFLPKETVPTMLSMVIPWAENFCTVFLAEQEKLYLLRAHASQVQESSSNPCTPRSVNESSEFNALARMSEKGLGGIGSASAGSTQSAGFDSPGREVPGIGSRGGSTILISSKNGRGVAGLSQLHLLESRLSFGSFADSLDGYSVGSDGPDMDDMGPSSGNGYSQTFVVNTQVNRSQIMQSEWMLLCVFQMTKLCGWPPLHSHQLRALWEAVLAAPDHSRDLVAVYITEFLLHSHMSGADPPEFSGYIQRGGTTVNGYARDPAGSLSQQKNSVSRRGTRQIFSRSNSASRADAMDDSGMSVGLDQRLAKLVVSYIMSSSSGPLIFQRLLANVRSYTMVAGSDSRGLLSIAWETARFTSWAVSSQEHSALVLLTDTAYQQDYVLVPHLPTLLHCAIVLLRPRIEHRCPESHALIPYIVHSLAVRCAPHKKVRELAQEFINKFYPSRAPLAHMAPIPGMEHQEPGGPLDPEECLSTPFVLELVSLLSYHRPQLRVDWAEMALSWTIHSTDKRIVLDSLRVFTVLNQSISISLLAKVGRLLLAAIRIEEHGVADALLEIFGKASMILKKETEMPRSEEPSEALASSWLETWDMLSSVALTAMTTPSIRIFHRAITLVESLFCLQSLMTDTIQLVISLEPFWRVMSEVPLDVAISDLLFRGLFSTKTAPSTLWLYETFATAYADWLSADNKLVVMVLLLNAALVEMGEQGRCRAVIRFIENCGFALNDISNVFAGHEEGLYRQGAGANRPLSKPTGDKAPVPNSPTGGSTANSKLSFASKGNGEEGLGDQAKGEDARKAGSNGNAAEWTEHDRTGDSIPTATQDQSASRLVSRRDMLPGPIGAYSADGYQFFDDFFDAFSLVFPSEEVWTFALRSVIALIVRGQQLWRAPFMKLLRSLLLYHVHAWSEEHFGMVAEMLVQISSVEGTEIEEGMKQKGGSVREDPALVSAKEDIRAIIVECASFCVSQRVVDALHICLEMDRLKKEGSPVELRGSYRKSFSIAKSRGSSVLEGYCHQSTPSIADELFPGYSFGDPEIGVLKERARRWFLEYILSRQLVDSGEDMQRDVQPDTNVPSVVKLDEQKDSTMDEEFGRKWKSSKLEAQAEERINGGVGESSAVLGEAKKESGQPVETETRKMSGQDDISVDMKPPNHFKTGTEERSMEDESDVTGKPASDSKAADNVPQAEEGQANQRSATPEETREEEDEFEQCKKIEMVRQTLLATAMNVQQDSPLQEAAQGESRIEKVVVGVGVEHAEAASDETVQSKQSGEGHSVEEKDFKDNATTMRDSSDESDEEGVEPQSGHRESLVVTVKEVTLARREKGVLSEQPGSEMTLPVDVSREAVADDDGSVKEIGDADEGLSRQMEDNDYGSEKDESSDDDDNDLQLLVERLDLDESENEEDPAEVEERVKMVLMRVRGSMDDDEMCQTEYFYSEEKGTGQPEANMEAEYIEGSVKGGTEKRTEEAGHGMNQTWNERRDEQEEKEGDDMPGEGRDVEGNEKEGPEYEGDEKVVMARDLMGDDTRNDVEYGQLAIQDETTDDVSGAQLHTDEAMGESMAEADEAIGGGGAELVSQRDMSDNVDAIDMRTMQDEPRRIQLPQTVQRANAINAIIEEQRLRMSPTREEFGRRYGRQMFDAVGRIGNSSDDVLLGRPRPIASIGFGYRLGLTLDVKIKKPVITKGDEEKSEMEGGAGETVEVPDDPYDEENNKLPLSPLPNETEVEDEEESSDGEDMRSEFYDDESVHEESAWGTGGRGHDRGFSVGSPFEGLYIDQLQEMEVENRTKGTGGVEFGHMSQLEVEKSGPLEHRLMMPLKFPAYQVERLKAEWGSSSPRAREKAAPKFGVGGFYGMWGGGVDSDLKESESSSNRSSMGDGSAGNLQEHRRTNSYSSEGSSTSGDPDDGGGGVGGDSHGFGRNMSQVNESHTFIFRPGDSRFAREPERGPMDTSVLQSWADEDEQQHHSARSSPGFDAAAKGDEERHGSGRKPVLDRGRSSLLRRWLG